MEEILMKHLKKIWNSVTLKVLLLFIVIFLLLIDYYGLSLFRGTVDYERFGTVGEWFSNFAMLITIVIAALTIVNDKRMAEKDRNYAQRIRDSEQKQKYEEEQKQQELLSQSVYLWIGGKQDPITKQIRDYRVFLSNKTEAPVFEWWIYNESNELLACSKEFGPIIPGTLNEIRIDSLDKEQKLIVEFLSFNGRRWLRNGATIKEISHDK